MSVVKLCAICRLSLWRTGRLSACQSAWLFCTSVVPVLYQRVYQCLQYNHIPQPGCSAHGTLSHRPPQPAVQAYTAWFCHACLLSCAQESWCRSTCCTLCLAMVGLLNMLLHPVQTSMHARYAVCSSQYFSGWVFKSSASRSCWSATQLMLTFEAFNANRIGCKIRFS